MILKKIGRSRLYDNLHKTGVYFCMGLTGVGLVIFGTSIYDLFKKAELNKAQAEAARNKGNSSEESNLE